MYHLLTLLSTYVTVPVVPGQRVPGRDGRPDTNPVPSRPGCLDRVKTLLLMDELKTEHLQRAFSHANKQYAKRLN